MNKLVCKCIYDYSPNILGQKIIKNNYRTEKGIKLKERTNEKEYLIVKDDIIVDIYIEKKEEELLVRSANIGSAPGYLEYDINYIDFDFYINHLFDSLIYFEDILDPEFNRGDEISRNYAEYCSRNIEIIKTGYYVGNYAKKYTVIKKIEDLYDLEGWITIEEDVKYYLKKLYKSVYEKNNPHDLIKIIRKLLEVYPELKWESGDDGFDLYKIVTRDDIPFPF